MSDTKTVDVLAVVGRLVDLAENSGGRRGEDEIDNEPAIALFDSGVKARAAIAELIGAARPLVARSFDEARDNEDQRIAARKSGAYPPPEMLWCRADVLNPCWMPGTPYTGKHWGWTPDAEGDGEVCEHCRLRAALRACGGAA